MPSIHIVSFSESVRSRLRLLDIALGGATAKRQRRRAELGNWSAIPVNRDNIRTH